MTFQDRWDFIIKRCYENSKPLVQDRSEIEHIYNLMLGHNSYLEIGTAEGNSLYILADALMPGGKIVSIDYGESHTKEMSTEIMKLLSDSYRISVVDGNSHDLDIYTQFLTQKFDCVMIDAGHTLSDVMQDAVNYAMCAKKYVFFHDMQIPEVRAAFNWFSEVVKDFFTAETYIKSENFGYGILKRRK